MISARTLSGDCALQLRTWAADAYANNRITHDPTGSLVATQTFEPSAC